MQVKKLYFGVREERYQQLQVLLPSSKPAELYCGVSKVALAGIYSVTDIPCVWNTTLSVLLDPTQLGVFFTLHKYIDLHETYTPYSTI